MRRRPDPAAAVPAPTGWLVGVLVRPPGEDHPLRHFWAVAIPDRARAEWAALDRALLIGEIAASPHQGTEPVEAMAPLSPHAVAFNGLAPGEVRALGWKWPRRWLAG
jgi:hypothetical protein